MSISISPQMISRLLCIVIKHLKCTQSGIHPHAQKHCMRCKVERYMGYRSEVHSDVCPEFSEVWAIPPDVKQSPVLTSISPASGGGKKG